MKTRKQSTHTTQSNQGALPANFDAILAETPKGVSITIKVYPNAGKNEITDIHDNSLRLKIAAAPVKGKANKECVKLLADVFRMRKSQVVFQRGEMSRTKHVLLEGVSKEEVIAILRDKNIGAPPS
ncbi:MAG: DUF167 domain-containing protein [bacterium]